VALTLPHKNGPISQKIGTQIADHDLSFVDQVDRQAVKFGEFSFKTQDAIEKTIGLH
jgi:hypothetical protein